MEDDRLPVRRALDVELYAEAPLDGGTERGERVLRDARTVQTPMRVVLLPDPGDLARIGRRRAPAVEA